MRQAFRLFALVALAGLAMPCASATKEWIGTYGHQGLWSNGANWKDGTPPANGDRLLFDEANLYWWDMLNDMNGLVLDRMDFVGVINAVVHGNPITLTNPAPLSLVGGGSPLLFTPLTFAAPGSTVTASPGTGGAGFIDFPGGLVLNGGTFTINSPTYVWFNGPVSQLAPSSISVSAPHFQFTRETVGISGTISFQGGDFLGNEMPGVAEAIVTGNSYGMWSRTGTLATALDLRLTGGNPQFGFFATSTVGGPAIPLDITAPISITGPHIFSPGSDTTFDGPISGNGQVILSSTSGYSVTFSNAGNSYSGGTEVKAGSLRLVNTGSLAPGGALAIDSGGRANLGTDSQTANGFTCAGTFEIAAGASLQSTGPVNIIGCALQLDVAGGYFAPSTITLVANTSGSPVTGAFAGLPEGASVNVNGSARTITYHGGAGNDIVLVTPGTPHIQLDAQDYAVSSGQAFSIVATYTDAAGHGVAGIQLSLGYVCFSAGACLSLDGASPVLTDAGGKATFHVTAIGAGVVNVSVSDSNNTAQASALVTIGGPAGGVQAVQDMWWNPSENGWGMSLIQHNDVLFGALYIYDANGKPIWVVMPGGSWDSTHTVYSGAVYKPVGTPFYSYNAQNLQVGPSVGNVSITFQDANNAVIDYTLGGVSGRKFVTREIFANGSATPNRSDLWWGGSAQNGWGITVLQQGNTLFSVWYTYDSTEDPFWYVMPGGAWTSSDTYEGALYRTTGSPWVGKSYDPTKLQVINAGTYKFQFNGDAATFTYNADGHSGSIPLVREPF